MELRAGDRVAVSVPGSSANLGPGFDCVGLALEIRDRYQLCVDARPGLRVVVEGEGSGVVPVDETNLVARTVRAGLEAFGLPWLPGLATQGIGLTLTCDNAVPLGAGLGSSAAAAAGGFGLAFALARGGRLTAADLDLVNTRAGVLEGHPDNSSASVFGGLTLSWMPTPATVRTVRVDVHPGVDPVVLVPVDGRLSTDHARSVLPSQVPHGDAARQAGRTALLLHALTSEPGLLLDATEDWLHQEQRRDAYAASMGVVDVLRSLGHAAVVSGAGPSVLVLARAELVEQVVAEVRSWGRDWRLLRPGVAVSGLVTG